MKITEAEIRRISNFSDKGLLRYVQGTKPNLDQVIEKAMPLADAARLSGEKLAAARLEDFIESVKNIKILLHATQ